MKAIQLEQPKAFRVIDVPEPPQPGPGESPVHDPQPPPFQDPPQRM